MRLRKIYIFVIILSLLMPETTSENTDPSSEEKKDGLYSKEKIKNIKKSRTERDFRYLSRKRKKDAEEDLIVTEEERKRQETRDGQEIVRVPFTPMEETDEVLSSSGSRIEQPLENVRRSPE